MAQGGEDLGPKLEQLRPHVAAILRAVGMANAKRAALAPVDGDLAAMGRVVVGSADANEILQRVASAFGAELDVMYIQPARVAAAGHLAAALVAQQHRAAQGGGAVCFARGSPCAVGVGGLSWEDRLRLSFLAAASFSTMAAAPTRALWFSKELELRCAGAPM
jgi:hypothetical protein